MKFSLYSCFLFACMYLCLNNAASEAKLHCKSPPLEDVPTDWITMVEPCLRKIKNQIQEELTASMTYLAMGAHFSKDVVNRPGFAKFFFDSASEEREHAIKLIEYMLMRGGLTHDISQLIRDPMPKNDTWVDAVTALKEALRLEADVTRKLRDIAATCEAPGKDGENFNDYHLVDWLTSEYLDEQYKGQRELAGKISELGKLMKTHGALGEYLYDLKLSSGSAIPF